MFKKCPIRVAEWRTSMGPPWSSPGLYNDPTEGLPEPHIVPLYWPFVGSLHGAQWDPTQNFHTGVRIIICIKFSGV